jgi:glycosyltransferase involved in cell wall biosynthesis
MKHIFVSREYPPAPYAPGGIGTYVINIARLLAERGEEVHVVGQRWAGAPLEREVLLDGNLIIHRVGEDDLPRGIADPERFARERDGLRKTNFPKQWFGFVTAFLIERLVEEEGIDLIEGQEWEAPLYHFLLRRTLGLGPARTPPCIVQLHSPTEWICRFNGPAAWPRQYMSMQRMETFCIRAADALLCPSNTFSRQEEAHYRLGDGAVKVIHLPKGPMAPIDRTPETWARGSICFVGRLEPRKGVVEWVDAAAAVARENTEVHFDFIGADTRDLKETLTTKLPADLRSRFRFHGPKPTSELAPYWAQAKAAVVPSRWENFPNVCVEAMSSGLPVISTRYGGMVEMIEDGRTGWLAQDTGIANMRESLGNALRRCLAASADERARMGAAASQAIAGVCDNNRIGDEHIAFRASVLRQGAGRSLSASALCPHGDTSGIRRTTRYTGKAGIVIAARTYADAEWTLGTIGAQALRPAAIALVTATPLSTSEQENATTAAGQSVTSLVCPAKQRAECWNLGYAAIHAEIVPGFVLFLDGQDGLQPDCLASMDRAFAHRPEVGVVTPWIAQDKRPLLEAPLPPDLGHQLAKNDVGPASAFRCEAIEGANAFRLLPIGYDLWYLSTAIFARGWLGVTFPATLSLRHVRNIALPAPEKTTMRALRAEMLHEAAGMLPPMLLDLVTHHVPDPVAAEEVETGMNQLMTLFKTLVRRRISRVHRRLTARRPQQKANGHVSSGTV